MRAVDVAAAQRGGGGENDVAPERDFQKLPSAFSGAWSISSKVTRREIEESLVFVRRLDL